MKEVEEYFKLIEKINDNLFDHNINYQDFERAVLLHTQNKGQTTKEYINSFTNILSTVNERKANPKIDIKEIQRVEKELINYLFKQEKQDEQESKPKARRGRKPKTDK